MRIFLILFAFFLQSNALAGNAPAAIDSRIKTYVYSENEVFRLVVNYGYQTSIEFAEGEEIQTISVGNNYLWQLTPVGKRLFIKPLEDNVITNMTILTNKRSYQFELQSKNLTAANTDEELAYVIRFFYPDEVQQNQKIVAPKVETSAPPVTVNYVTPYNFNYTQEGSKAILPSKIFDDGTNTFFKFPPAVSKLPKFYSYDGSSQELLDPRMKGEYVVVNTVAPKFILEQEGKKVTVYNENWNGGAK